MTAAEVAPAGIARARVDRIKTGVEVIWSLIVESYNARDWDSLGYATWDEMCTREFGTSRLRLPREERAETVQSLREAGLSVRAIAAVTGDSKSTVAEIASRVQNRTPAQPAPTAVLVDTGTGEVFTAEPLTDELVDRAGEVLREFAGAQPITPAETHPTITGLDGKAYAPTNRKPPRKSLIDVAKTRGFGLRQSMDSLMHVFEDDRYRTNEKQVADALRGHLLYVAETVAAVLDQLP